MKNKKINIILSMLVVVLLWGCSGLNNQPSAEVKFNSPEIPKENYILKSYDYLNICEKKYQDFKLIGEGRYQCKNNGIKISMDKYSDNMGLANIGYVYDDKVKDETILKEINLIYKTNKLKEMNEKQFENLKKNGFKRVFNGMAINYGYDKETKEYSIFIYGHKITSEYPKVNYLD
jgi:hypothetical protein